jgi:ribosomal protein S20
MRKLLIGLCVAAVASGALFVAPAGAAPPAPAKSKLCKLLTNIKIDPSTDYSAAGGKENAKKYSKALTKAAKKAKGDIKSTLKTMAKYFKAIANEDTQAIQDQAQDFAQAVTKYANYTVRNCVSENLPSGVSIPKIPGS